MELHVAVRFQLDKVGLSPLVKIETAFPGWARAAEHRERAVCVRPPFLPHWALVRICGPVNYEETFMGGVFFLEVNIT